MLGEIKVAPGNSDCWGDFIVGRMSLIKDDFRYEVISRRSSKRIR